MNYYKFDFQRGVSTCIFQSGKLSQSFWIDQLQKTNLLGTGYIFWLSRLPLWGNVFSIFSWDGMMQGYHLKKSNTTFSYSCQFPDCNPILIGASVQLLCGYSKGGWVWLLICFIIVSGSDDMNCGLHKAQHKVDMWQIVLKKRKGVNISNKVQERITALFIFLPSSSRQSSHSFPLAVQAKGQMGILFSAINILNRCPQTLFQRIKETSKWPYERWKCGLFPKK